jgi:hypothetical protein
LAAELAALAGGPGILADRAQQLLALAEGAPDGAEAEQALRIAGHLAEHAWLAAPDDPGVQRARQEVFAARAQRATSTMARGVFTWASNESVAPAGDPADNPSGAAPETHTH